MTVIYECAHSHGIGLLAYLVPRNHLTSAHRGGYKGGSPQKFIYNYISEGSVSHINGVWPVFLLEQLSLQLIT